MHKYLRNDINIVNNISENEGVIMSEKNRIGNKVKLIRENRKLSIEDVSERSNLSVKSIESIENGYGRDNVIQTINVYMVEVSYRCLFI